MPSLPKNVIVCRRAALFLALAFLLLTGCGDGRPAQVQVMGKVVYNGSPVENATVTFLARSGRPASGTTQADGRFTLGTFDVADGAVLGEHVVTITKRLKVDNEQTPGAKSIRKLSSDDSKQMIILANFLPDKYGDYQQTHLKATVTADGPNDFTFELSDRL